MIDSGDDDPPRLSPRFRNIAVRRLGYKPQPSFLKGLECWIIAGGAHHTVLSFDITDEAIRDFARIMKIELVPINASTTCEGLERDLMLGDIIYRA